MPSDAALDGAAMRSETMRGDGGRWRTMRPSGACRVSPLLAALPLRPSAAAFRPLVPLLLLAACASPRDAALQERPDSTLVAQAFLGHTLWLPAGFQVSLFADGVDGVRFMALGPGGEVYATRTESGKVVRFSDQNHNGVADRVSTVLTGLNEPHGLAFRGETLYVAETNRVVRFDLPRTTPVVLVPNLPSGGGHSTRTLLLRGDQMYVSIGSSCNLCDESDRRRAAVVRYRLDGSGEELFATGLRNSVGLAFSPETGDLWATNNDRDNLGDDLPPDRVNILRHGRFYGWPLCYLPGKPNPEYASQAGTCGEVTGPAVAFPAHSAPLGLAFYQGTTFPEQYRGSAFVAFHGSWNRSFPTGYRVVFLPTQKGAPTGGWKNFILGWQEGRRRWGRPVDVLPLSDGSMLISDDEGGRIYRVTYGGAVSR